MYKLCKTEQSAVRQRELELALADMMRQQRYEEISVSEFCSHVGIPRKAFYRYFSSKDGALYALIDHTMLEYEQYRDPNPGFKADSLLREVESFFRFWQRQKPLLDALAFSGLSGVLPERAIAAVESGRLIRQRRDTEQVFAQKRIVRFAVSGIMFMMIDWHRDGYRESAREMAELTVRMVTQPLLHYIRELI